jgi:hypothetical protein
VEVPQKAKNRPPYDPATPLLGTFPKECRSAYNRGMFIAALFTTLTLWDHSTCPSTDEWIKKTWYIYTMEYYSATKRTESCHFQVDGWN